MRVNIVYSLIIPVRSRSSIKIGALGNLKFEKGFYVYTGSSMSYGMKRVLRHTSKNKKLRWHIDYLLNSHPFSHVIFAEVERKMECEVASKLRNTAFGEAPKFGSSDCNCKSHLFYFPSFSEAVTLSEKSYVELGLKPKILRIQELLRESPVI